MCEATKGEVDCKKRDVVYKINCNGTKRRRNGHTANSHQELQKQHNEKLKVKNQGCILETYVGEPYI